MMLTACGGSSSSSSTVENVTLAGNWQFAVAPPSDGSFLGGLQGGFLLQNGSSATGAAAYSVSLPELLIPCSSGTAQITGTLSGQTVTLTAVAGTQTFTFTGTLALNSTPVVGSTVFVGETMSGTYTSTAGTAADGTACGTAQTGLQWSAVLVPPITGIVQGSFHSTGGAANLSNQDFLLSGSLTQEANTGKSSATVSGSLNFTNPATTISDYPCFDTASVYGQVSGSSVTLQIVGSDQSILGQIGEPADSNGVTGLNPVTVQSASSGYILQGTGPSYMVATSMATKTPCPGSLSNTLTAGDYGNVCLALETTFGSDDSCPQAVTLSPSSLTFLPQVLGSPSTTQLITLANTSGATLDSLTVSLANLSGAKNFAATDTCGASGAPSQGQPFNLDSGASCVVTVTFAPLQTCAAGLPSTQCPSSVTATLTVAGPNSETFSAASITGTGLSSSSSIRGFDFGAPGILEANLPQPLLFAGRNGHPVRILPSSSHRTFQDVERHAYID